MGLLDSILTSALKGMAGQGETQALPAVLSQILGQTDLGSVGGLLSRLQQGGLDRQVASWLGNGTNLPITPDQLRAALGQGHVQQLGSSAGVPGDQLLKMLSQLLPGAVDHMSPKGTLVEPPADEGGTSGNDSASGSLSQQAGLDEIKP
jgi:uncharacterized protein YidB (DUF937 family)